MQWLNKFDDALESALKAGRPRSRPPPAPNTTAVSTSTTSPSPADRPSSSPRPIQERESGSTFPEEEEGDEDVPSLPASSTRTSDDDGGRPHVSTSFCDANGLRGGDAATTSDAAVTDRGRMPTASSSVAMDGPTPQRTATPYDSARAAPASVPKTTISISTPRSLPGSLVKKKKLTKATSSKGDDGSASINKRPRAASSDNVAPTKPSLVLFQELSSPPSAEESGATHPDDDGGVGVVTAVQPIPASPPGAPATPVQPPPPSSTTAATPTAARVSTPRKGPGRIRRVPAAPPQTPSSSESMPEAQPAPNQQSSSHGYGPVATPPQQGRGRESSSFATPSRHDVQVDASTRSAGRVGRPSVSSDVDASRRHTDISSQAATATVPHVSPIQGGPTARLDAHGLDGSVSDSSHNDFDDHEMQDVDLGIELSVPSPTGRTQSSFREAQHVVEQASEPAADRDRTSRERDVRHEDRRGVVPSPTRSTGNRGNDSAALEDDSQRSIPPSLPRNVEFKSEFDVDLHRVGPGWIPGPINDDSQPAAFDERKNCYGYVRVRPIRAQRLSCSVGTAVHAVISLPPWDGKIRTRSTKAFAAERKRHGVCVQWESHESSGDDAGRAHEASEEDVDDDGINAEHGPIVSMVHAYSGEETPVPRIRVDLVFKLVFEFTVASFEIPCQELMEVPNVPRRQWFAATAGVKHQLSDHTPLLELEAVFEPADMLNDNSEPSPTMAPLPSAVANLEDDGMPVDSIEVGSVASSLQEELVTLPTPSLRASHHSRSKLGYTGSTHDDRDAVSVSQHSLARGEGRPFPTTPHMLQTKSYWTPAVCCVCRRSIMSGITKTRAYHCEVCRIDCCGDCRLQVDVQLPCGSELATRARADVIQNRLTVENIINTVAPPAASNEEESISVEGGVHETRNGASRAVDSTTSIRRQSNVITKSCIGTMSFSFQRASVFEKPISSDSEPDLSKNDIAFRKGDYYIRVTPSSGTETKRTRTMQNTGRPKFDSGAMTFSVPHYGTEFCVELVDALTNVALGAGIITTQSQLLRQRDSFVAKYGLPILFPLHGPPASESQHYTLELLSGVKSGAEYFSSTSSATASNRTKVGSMIGTIEMSARMDESFDFLFGKDPYECPAPPPGELNLAVFGVHLSRLLSLIEDIRSIVGLYVFVISWRNPVITAGSLVMFTYFCLKLDAEYIGNVPAAFLVMSMLFLAVARWRDRLRRRLLDKEEDELKKSLAVTIDRSLHRPAGKIAVGVGSGRNLRSADLGLPGMVGVRVVWDPTRYLDSAEQTELAKFDKTATTVNEIASTNYVYTMNPSFSKLEASDVARRLKHLLPSDAGGGFFQDDGPTSHDTVVYPILQPVSLSRHEDIPRTESWSDSPGAIVFEVRFQDTISLLPGTVYVLGEVVVPMAKLTQHKKIEGWFQVVEAGSTRMVALGATGSDASDTPQIHIRVAWTAPATYPEGPSDTEREASFVIQEEMVRSAVASKAHKLGLVGSSLGAINTVRGLSDNLLLVQNALGMILDVLGSVRNAFNFSDPFKSSILFWFLALLWVLLTVIPTRLLVLIAGLAQYAAMFATRFGHLLKRTSRTLDKKRDKSVETSPADSTPVGTWIVNAFRGLPTDEDIRKTYFWECRRYAVRRRKETSESRRDARLQRLWRAQFYSTLTLFGSKDGTRSSVFCMIQGHRFLWWHSVDDFDAGEEPIGLVFLSGHAGLASPSPLELKLIDKNELPRVVSLFGRGRDKQERVTLMAPSEDVKSQLEYAVSFATSEKKD